LVEGGDYYYPRAKNFLINMPELQKKSLKNMFGFKKKNRVICPILENILKNMPLKLYFYYKKIIKIYLTFNIIIIFCLC
jgi:hypothetical protein